MNENKGTGHNDLLISDNRHFETADIRNLSPKQINFATKCKNGFDKKY